MSIKNIKNGSLPQIASPLRSLSKDFAIAELKKFSSVGLITLLKVNTIGNSIGKKLDALNRCLDKFYTDRCVKKLDIGKIDGDDAHFTTFFVGTVGITIASIYRLAQRIISFVSFFLKGDLKNTGLELCSLVLAPVNWAWLVLHQGVYGSLELLIDSMPKQRGIAQFGREIEKFLNLDGKYSVLSSNE